jgi:hypothetical protein
MGIHEASLGWHRGHTPTNSVGNTRSTGSVATKRTRSSSASTGATAAAVQSAVTVLHFPSLEGS